MLDVVNEKEQQISATLTPVEAHPMVHLVITTPDGKVLGVFGSESKILTDTLSFCSQAYPEEVKKSDDLLLPLGQDCYQVSREFLLGIKRLLFFLKLSDMKNLEQVLPLSSKLTFVVSY